MGIVAAKDFAARFAAARVVADLSSGALFQMFAAVFRRVLQPRRGTRTSPAASDLSVLAPPLCTWSKWVKGRERERERFPDLFLQFLCRKAFKTSGFFLSSQKEQKQKTKSTFKGTYYMCNGGCSEKL
jgi:hypothetical protein